MLKSFSYLKTRKFLIHFLCFFGVLVCLHAILKSIVHDDASTIKTIYSLSILSFVIARVWILFNLRRPGKTLGKLLGINIPFSKLDIVQSTKTG